MESLVIIVFVLGYLAITLEHNLKIDKLIPALGMMAVSWALISLGHLDVFEVDTKLLRLEPTHMDEILLHHLGKTSEILVFLIGAMTIVEIIDYFNGFSAIKDFVKTNSKVRLLWIFSILAFILSAIIDNLTATIVLITILRKIIKEKEDRLWFAGLIIIAANAVVTKDREYYPLTSSGSVFDNIDIQTGDVVSKTKLFDSAGIKKALDLPDSYIVMNSLTVSPSMFEEQADIYPRLAPTCEWDTGAGHAIAEIAGATVSKLDGSPLLYNSKEEYLNPFFVVSALQN